MIRAITIDNYKSYTEFSVKLKPLSVLFGPNAAGKSNFLDALQLLSQLTSAKVLKNAFDFPYRGKPIESFSFPPDGVEGLLRQDTVSFRMTVDVELSSALMARINKEIGDMRRGVVGDRDEPVREWVMENLLQYSIVVEFMPKQGYLRIRDESLAALRKDMKGIKESRNPFLCKTDDGRRLSLRLEGQAHPTYFDLGMDHTILSLPLYPPHYPHITAFKRELEGWRFFYFEPRIQMRQTAPTVKEAHHIGQMGEDLVSYIHGLKLDPLKASKFQSLNRALKSLIPSIDTVDTRVDTKTGEIELIINENGRPVSSRLMSEGTLRLLGLLTIAGDKDNTTVICFEEPENGVNPRKIKEIAEFLKRTATGDTQVIATTHSPVLPDQIPNSCLYICRRKGNSTEILPFTESGLFRRTKIDDVLDEDAPLLSELIMRGDIDA
jgi:predicted ATPase